MQHQLRFFRFNHRTHVPTGVDLKMEDFFAEQTVNPNEGEEVKLLEEAKSRPQKHKSEDHP